MTFKPSPYYGLKRTLSSKIRTSGYVQAHTAKYANHFFDNVDMTNCTYVKFTIPSWPLDDVTVTYSKGASPEWNIDGFLLLWPASKVEYSGLIGDFQLPSVFEWTVDGQDEDVANNFKETIKPGAITSATDTLGTFDSPITEIRYKDGEEQWIKFALGYQIAGSFAWDYFQETAGWDFTWVFGGLTYPTIALGTPALYKQLDMSNVGFDSIVKFYTHSERPTGRILLGTYTGATKEWDIDILSSSAHSNMITSYRTEYLHHWNIAQDPNRSSPQLEYLKVEWTGGNDDSTISLNGPNCISGGPIQKYPIGWTGSGGLSESTQLYAEKDFSGSYISPGNKDTTPIYKNEITSNSTPYQSFFMGFGSVFSTFQIIPVGGYHTISVPDANPDISWGGKKIVIENVSEDYNGVYTISSIGGHILIVNDMTGEGFVNTTTGKLTVLNASENKEKSNFGLRYQHNSFGGAIGTDIIPDSKYYGYPYIVPDFSGAIDPDKANHWLDGSLVGKKIFIENAHPDHNGGGYKIIHVIREGSKRIYFQKWFGDSNPITNTTDYPGWSFFIPGAVLGNQIRTLNDTAIRTMESKPESGFA